jgi:hypothetical protein
MEPPDKTGRPEVDPGPAERVARRFCGAGNSPQSRRRAIGGWLAGAVFAAVLVPLLFFLRFGQVAPFAWGVTVFMVGLCLLAAVGIYFLRRPEYHSPVPLRGDWLDRVGAFWLLACAFGPLAGWVLTELPALTVDNWRWLYAGRVALSMGLPVLTALPLLRYVRGRGAPVMLALLMGVTLLPMLSSLAVARDLWAGPVGLRLAHTAQTLLAP